MFIEYHIFWYFNNNIFFGLLFGWKIEDLFFVRYAQHAVFLFILPSLMRKRIWEIFILYYFFLNNSFVILNHIEIEKIRIEVIYFSYEKKHLSNSYIIIINYYIIHFVTFSGTELFSMNFMSIWYSIKDNSGVHNIYPRYFNFIMQITCNFCLFDIISQPVDFFEVFRYNWLILFRRGCISRSLIKYCPYLNRSIDQSHGNIYSWTQHQTALPKSDTWSFTFPTRSLISRGIVRCLIAEK